MGLKDWLNELKKVSEPTEEGKIDNATIEELAKMGIEDKTADIENNSCNWEVKRRKLSAQLAAEVDERAAGENAVSKAVKRKTQAQQIKE